MMVMIKVSEILRHLNRSSKMASEALVKYFINIPFYRQLGNYVLLYYICQLHGLLVKYTKPSDEQKVRNIRNNCLAFWSLEESKVTAL